MNWNAGSQHPWPSQPFRIISGELLLVSNGGLDFGLMRMERNVVYPGLPDAAGAGIRITLMVIQESRLEISAGASGQEGCQWLDEQLSQLLGIAASAVPSSDPWLSKAAALHHQFEQRHQALLDTHQPLNSSPTETLWLAMEQGKPPQEPTEDDVLRALSLLCKDHGAIFPLPARHKGLEPRQRLEQLLDRTDLFARDVLIDRADLQQDCGDLIGFLDTESGEQTEVMVLQSTAKGYLAWVPSQMSRAQPLEDCNRYLKRLSPRMLSITPAFRPKDLTTIGLLRFAYGHPRNTTSFVIGGLLLGVAVGFLLAVGRDVGAARWIFGMGLTGLLMGACLGVVERWIPPCSWRHAPINSFVVVDAYLQHFDHQSCFA